MPAADTGSEQLSTLTHSRQALRAGAALNRMCAMMAPGINRDRKTVTAVTGPSLRPRMLVQAIAACAFALASPAAVAHTGAGVAGGVLSGLAHPAFGPDHVVAMVAVGLWGAFLGMPAIWILPVVFPLVMALGGVLGIFGVPVPGVEAGIAASAVVLGAAVALSARPPLWVAGAVVGAFAIFHGHAHGTELPQAADALAYSVGFVVATGLLHLCGIAFGLLVRWQAGRVAVRMAGASIAVAGLAFLIS